MSGEKLLTTFKILIGFSLILIGLFLFGNEVLASYCCSCGDCCCSEGCGGNWGRRCPTTGRCIHQAACGVWQICSGGNCCCQGGCLEPPSNPRYYSNLKRPFNVCSPEGEEQMKPNEIYLPVKLDWDDVMGWIGGPRGCDKCEPERACHTCDQGCVRSYVIEIEGVKRRHGGKGRMNNCKAMKEIAELKNKIEEAKTLEELERYARRIREIRKKELIMYTYQEVVGPWQRVRGSEWYPACPCFFNTNSTYRWRVKACCGPNGDNCGPWSEWWSFTTKHAPEPKSPFDPDWAGKEKAENVSKLIVLNWCGQSQRGDYNTKEECDEAKYIWNIKFESCFEPSFNFVSFLIENGEKECHPKLLDEKNRCLVKLLGQPDPVHHFFYHQDKLWNDLYRFFTKEYTYSWQVAACEDEGGVYCPDYCPIGEFKKCPGWQFSQEWKLQLENFKLEPPQLTYPPDDPEWKTPVGLPITFTWIGGFGSNTYIFSIESLDGKWKKEIKASTESAVLDHPDLKPATRYKWKVQPCWTYKVEEIPKKCERSVWSETFVFESTGRPPKIETMYPQGENIPIPVTFQWEAVPGAQSYRFGFYSPSPTEPGSQIVTFHTLNEPTITFDYPDLVLGTNYSWTVMSCARRGIAAVCGPTSPEIPFKTFKIPPPKNLHPSNGGELFIGETEDHYIFWEPVPHARFYQYKVEYIEVSPQEKDPDCKPGVIIPETVTERADKKPLTLKCLGKYKWQVRSCIDPKGECRYDAVGHWAEYNFQLLTLVGPQAPLIPCGQEFDFPNTPWKESEPCEIKHFFILLRNIFTFLIQIILPLSLVVLLIATGIFFYLSKESLETIATIKRMWRAAGIGFGLIIFAWLIVDLILRIMGYPVGIFKWWEIKF